MEQNCDVMVTKKSTRYANLTYVDYDMLPNCVLQKDMEIPQYKIDFLFEW